MPRRSGAAESDFPPEALALMAERDAVPDDQLTLCTDCGIDAWVIEEDGNIVHEDFYVSNELWDATCPDDNVVRWTTSDGTELGQGRFVICIGCFERRLGRQLTLRDFVGQTEFDAMSEAERDALAETGPESWGIPSKRYIDRWRTLQ